MQSPVRSLIAGLSASGVSAVMGMTMVPFYVRALGSEGYGLVALFITLHGILQLFDSGLTTTASREVARARAQQQLHGLADLVRALTGVAWGVAAVIVLALAASTPVLAHHWLQMQKLTAADVTLPLLLIALALGLRWPVGLYQHLLLGADQLTRWSAISIFMTLATHAGALAVLLVGGAGLTGFFAWQVVAALVHVAWARRAAVRVLDLPRRPWPGFEGLRSVSGFFTAATLVAAAGLVLTHLDKLVLSRMLPLAAFGEYMLVAMVAGVLYVLVTPVFQWVYPRFSAAAARDPQQVEALYRFVTVSTASVLLPLAMLIAFGGEALLTLWLGDAEVAQRMAPVLAMLAAGTALHSVMFITYALTLARGAATIALRINIALVILLGPLLVLLTARYGAEGAAAAWLALHACNLLAGGWITHRALLPGVHRMWLGADVGPPALAAAGAWTLGEAILGGALRGAAPATVLALAVLLCVLTWLVLVGTSSRLRTGAGRLFLKLPA